MGLVHAQRQYFGGCLESIFGVSGFVVQIYCIDGHFVERQDVLAYQREVSSGAAEGKPCVVVLSPHRFNYVDGAGVCTH